MLYQTLFTSLLAVSLVEARLTQKRAHHHHELGQRAANLTRRSNTQVIKGDDFWSFFNFETSTDGVTRYISMQEAQQAGLAYVDSDGAFVLKVGSDPNENPRRSHRLSTSQTFNAGVQITFDVLEMPSGCGTWPALWMTGPNWPAGGEIDLIETVNEMTYNSMSLHTGSPAWMNTNAGFASSFMMSGPNQANCDVEATNSQGCGMRLNDASSAGVPFNNGGGGLIVLDWSSSAIKIHQTPRGQARNDGISLNAGAAITNIGAVLSGQPAIFEGFDIPSLVHDQQIVLNTLLGSTWVDGVWSSDASYAGQSQSCSSKTGYGDASSFITSPNFVNQAKSLQWRIGSITITKTS